MRSLAVFSAMTAPSMATNIFATSYGGTIDTVSVDTSNGQTSVTHAGSLTACGSMPSWLTLDAANSTLYCSNEGGSDANTAAALSDYSTSSALTQINSVTGMGGGVNSHLYGGADGASFLCIAGYETSSVFTYALPLDADSTALQTFTYTLSQPGTDPSRQDAPHPHQATTDPTGNFMLVSDLGADMIRLYSVDGKTGKLTELPPFNLTGGTGPRHLAFYQPTAGSSDGTVMYLVSELANTLQSFSVDYSNGGIAFTQLQDPVYAYPSGTAPDGSYIAEVQVNGQILTVSNRGDKSFNGADDSLAVFSLDTSGNFTFSDLYSSHGSYPRSFVINKAGDMVAVGNQNSQTVVVLSRDPSTGALSDVLGSVTLGGQVSSVIWDE